MRNQISDAQLREHLHELIDDVSGAKLRRIAMQIAATLLGFRQDALLGNEYAHECSELRS